MSATAPTRGVVFDCDGTLADTEPLSEATWTEVLAGFGYRVTAADRDATTGRPYARTYAHYASRVPLPAADELRSQVRTGFRERFDRDLVLFEDALTVLRVLSGEGVAIAVASSSPHDHVDRVLARAGIAGLVAAVVGADDVTDHKPHPRPYRLAAAKLGVAIPNCRAVEDSPVGIASATAAGLFTVAVRRGETPAGSLTGADRVVDHLERDHLEPPPWN